MQDTEAYSHETIRFKRPLAERDFTTGASTLKATMTACGRTPVPMADMRVELRSSALISQDYKQIRQLPPYWDPHGFVLIAQQQHTNL